jgi:hypothetical protein
VHVLLIDNVSFLLHFSQVFVKEYLLQAKLRRDNTEEDKENPTQKEKEI